MSLSASLCALSSASFCVSMAQGLVAAADWRMAWEKSGREAGDSRWKATDEDPADSAGRERERTRIIETHFN